MHDYATITYQTLEIKLFKLNYFIENIRRFTMMD